MQGKLSCRNVERSAKQGFTLIELLVVIAIIAILAAILFPVFARARENARRASCQSNMKQISLALTQYNQDYDERMPFGGGITCTGQTGGNEGTTGINNGVWVSMLYPYMKSTQLVVCPSGPSHYHSGDNYYKDIAHCANATGTGPGKLSYIINDTNRVFGAIWWPQDVKTLAGIEDTSGTIWLLDGMGGNTSHGGAGNTAATTIPEGGNTRNPGAPQSDCWEGSDQKCISGRHLGGLNAAYFDGHVKWLPYSKVRPDAISTVGSFSPASGD